MLKPHKLLNTKVIKTRTHNVEKKESFLLQIKKVKKTANQDNKLNATKPSWLFTLSPFFTPSPSSRTFYWNSLLKAHKNSKTQTLKETTKHHYS